MNDLVIACIGTVLGDLCDIYYEYDVPTEDLPVMGDIRAIFTDDGEYRLEHTDIGTGANVEALLFYISLPFTLVGGISGIAYLAEKFNELKKRWKERTAGTLLFPSNVAFTMSAPSIFTENQLERIRLLKSYEIKLGPEWAKLGNCPFLYCYVIGIVTEEDEDDEFHILLLRDDGEVLIHQETNINLFLKMFGDERALQRLFEQTAT
ncbi:MAG: hypothetical protein H5T73_00845 [Actinobacteria bacterium]|nr:hypothetical protein [Actinomycetota bacterium]